MAAVKNVTTKLEREKALRLAVDVASAHQTLQYPGAFVMGLAPQFAEFLANGAPLEEGKSE